MNVMLNKFKKKKNKQMSKKPHLISGANDFPLMGLQKSIVE